MEKYLATLYFRLSYANEKKSDCENFNKSKRQESDSIVNQKKLLHDFVKQHPEIEIVSEKIDDGYSGIIFDRPAFQEMMQDVESGRINCVIVKDLSRLGREYIETGRYLRNIFPSYGVRFIAVNDGIDTMNDNTADELTVSVKNIMNEAYCRDISLKTRSSLEIKRRNGEYVGSMPVYGYCKSEENRNQLMVDDFAAHVVQDIYRMRLDGSSAQHIAGELNRLGVLSPLEYKKHRGISCPTGGYADHEGAMWSATTVIRILQDETYTGTLVQGRRGTSNYKLKDTAYRPDSEWIRTPDTHSSIISKQDFELVQRIRRLDTRTAPGGKQVYLFSGLLVCGSCGGRMTRKTMSASGKKYFYYHCPTGKKNGCNAPMVKESRLVSCVLEMLGAHIHNVVSLGELLDSINISQINHQLAAQHLVQIQANARRLEQIRHYKAGLHENFISGVLDKDDYLTLKTQYTGELRQLEEANEQLAQEREDTLAGTSERYRWIEHFKKFSSMQELDRKAVVQLIRYIRIIGKKTLDITFNYQDEYGRVLSALKSGQEVAS